MVRCNYRGNNPEEIIRKAEEYARSLPNSYNIRTDPFGVSFMVEIPNTPDGRPDYDEADRHAAMIRHDLSLLDPPHIDCDLPSRGYVENRK